MALENILNKFVQIWYELLYYYVTTNLTKVKTSFLKYDLVSKNFCWRRILVWKTSNVYTTKNMLLKWIKLTSKRLVDNIAQLLKVYLKKKVLMF